LSVYTVEQLLLEDELLQELRDMHPLLIDFFAKETSIMELLKYLLQLKTTNKLTMTTTITTNSNKNDDDDKESIAVKGEFFFGR